MNIIKYPNDILETPCEPVTEFNDELRDIITKMKDVMQKAGGIGLSANQVGISKSFFIIKDSKGSIVEFINPKIIDVEGMVNFREGCLSAPNVYLNVFRPEAVLIEYQDVTGEKRKTYAEGLEARTILHEYDHLQGVFYFSKVNRATRKAALSQLKRR
jgi:peptide deformylase